MFGFIQPFSVLSRQSVATRTRYSKRDSLGQCVCGFLGFLDLPNLLSLRKSTHGVRKMMPDKKSSCIYSTVPGAP